MNVDNAGWATTPMPTAGLCVGAGAGEGAGAITPTLLRHIQLLLLLLPAAF